MSEIAVKLAQLEALATEGKAEAAERLLRNWDTESVPDAGLHLRLADLCEELELTRRLIAELRLACQYDPDNPAPRRRLAQVYLDMGKTGKAIGLLQKVVATWPAEVEAWEELGAALSDQGRQEEARDIYNRAAIITGEAGFRARARVVELEPATGPEIPEGAYSEAVLARFVSLFSGREGVYARQWVGKGGVGYSPVHEPFSERVVRNHLLGNETIGIYPVRQDQTVWFAALDIDLRKTVVRAHRPNSAGWTQAMEDAHQYALQLHELSEFHALPTVLEDSGGKGRHLWVFFAQPMTARRARRVVRRILALGGAPPSTCQVELFPKQDACGPGELGNLIKLPMGVHRGTGRKGLFLDSQGRPPANQDSFLLSIERASAQAIEAFLEQTEGLPEPEESTPELGEPDLDEDAPTYRALPVATPYNPERDGQAQLLISRCHVLREILQKIDTTQTLSHEEALVVTHTMGYLKQGVEATNHHLSKCPTVHPQSLLKSRLRGKPVSCEKIRQKVPEIVERVPCHCLFPEQAGIYAHPILHLEVGSGLSVDQLDQVRLQALVSDYQRLRTTINDLQRQLQLTASQLESWFRLHGVDRLVTGAGTLCRIESPDGQVQFVLEL